MNVFRYPARRSVTELEFQHGFLRAPNAMRAFVYIRDQRFMHDVPDEFKANFAPADRDAFALIEALKDDVRRAAAGERNHHQIVLI